MKTKMKKSICAIATGMLISAAFGQNNEKNDTGLTQITKTIPSSFNFKRGIEVVAPDSLFSLNFRFRVQSRALYFTESFDDFSMAETEARIRRLRLRLEGFMYSPKLTYLVQLSFARGDMDWNVRDNSAVNNSPNVVRDAVAFYRPDRHWTFIFGQTKLPGNRQRVVSSGDLQFLDRSIVNSTFNIDRDFGFQAHYQNNFGKLNYVLKGAISSGEGRNVASTDRGLNYTGRIELLPLGEFKNRGDYFEGDLEREEIPKISLAGGMNFNELAMRTAGTLGKDLYQPRSMETYIFDGLMKYRGFALYLEYMKRWAENPITSNNENQKRHVFTGNGMLVQSSYLLKNNYEIAARYAIVTPTPTIRSVEKKEEVITAGLTKYLIRHKLKVQGNVSYHKSDNYIASPAEHWSIGFQLELGI